MLSLYKYNAVDFWGHIIISKKQMRIVQHVQAGYKGAVNTEFCNKQIK